MNGYSTLARFIAREKNRRRNCRTKYLNFSVGTRNHEQKPFWKSCIIQISILFLLSQKIALKSRKCLYYAIAEVERMEMLLCTAAQTFNLNYQLHASSGPLRINKIECRFGNCECLFRKFNLSSDWFGNFECLVNFERPILHFVLHVTS